MTLQPWRKEIELLDFSPRHVKKRFSSVLAKRVFFGSLAILAVILLGTMLMHGHMLQKENMIASRAETTKIIESIKPAFKRAIWQINDDSIQTYLDSLVTHEEMVATRYKDEIFELEAGHSTFFNEASSYCDEVIVENFEGMEIDGNIIEGGELSICFHYPKQNITANEFIRFSDLPFLLAIVSTSLILVIFTWNLVISPLRSLSQHIADHKPIETFQRVSFLGLDKEDDEVDDLVNELKKLTLALNEERAILNASFPEIVDAIVQTDRKHHVQRYNRALEKFLDLEGQAMGYDLSLIIPRKALEDPTNHKSIFTVNDRILEISSSKMFNNKSTIGYLHVIRDLTTVKHLQAEALQGSNLAAIGTMAGGIAHDYNNILATVLNNAEYLAQSKNRPQSEMQALDAIIEASSHGTSLSSQLLEFAQNRELNMEHIRTEDVVKKLVTSIKPSLRKGIHLEVDESIDRYVYADFGALQNAMRNLILNAQDAIEGEGTIKIKTESISVDGQEAAAFVVEDDGMGIPEEIMNKIQEPFFTTKSVGKGTGLGLAMVTRFVESHHGDIEFKSEPGQGTSVKIILPSQKILKRTQNQKSETSKDVVSGVNILLIEDEKPLAKVLQTFLEGDGHNVNIAHSLTDLKKNNYAHRYFDLVISDIVLADETVLEAYRYLVSYGYNPPLMLITGNIDEASSGLIDELNPVGVLEKPFRAGELLHSIHKTLERLNEEKSAVTN